MGCCWPGVLHPPTTLDDGLLCGWRQECRVHPTKEGGSLRLKTVDKLGGLRLLGRHLGMFGERADPGAVAGVPEPGPLETVADVRREAAELYRRACRGEVSAGGASRLAGLLTLSARVIEGAELEARLDALERRLGGTR